MKLKELECKGKSDLVDPIPDDLTVEILSRLPGKSLMKFQCVSKFWFSIIRSQRFVDSYLSKSLNRGSRLLITFSNGLFTHENAQKRMFFFSASNEGEKMSSSSLVTNLNMKIASEGTDHYYTKGTLAHGFLCCSYQGRFLICNPTTRQVVTLPESTGDENKITLKYLGYDPINNQYKALCATFSRTCNYGDVEHKVLTLGRGDSKNLSWREIEDNTEPYNFFTTRGICINGVVYYGATRPNMDGVIVCFDVRFEKISLMNPPFHINRSSVAYYLINYKGKLAVIHSVDSVLSIEFILWILENPGKHEWSKKTCKFPRSDLFPADEIHSYSFIGINKTGEIILAPRLLPRNVEPFHVFYCDITSLGIRRVRLEGIADDEEFRRHYGIGKNGDCYVFISAEYFEDITFL